MSDVKLFVGAKCERRDGSVAEIVERCKFVYAHEIYSFKTNDGRTYIEDGTYLIGLIHQLDIVKALNPEDDPDPCNSSQPEAATSRTAPPEIPDNLSECWERCAFGYKPSPEELRALWSLAGFPLPPQRKRCNACDCTGQVTRPNPDYREEVIRCGPPSLTVTCEICRGRGYRQ